MAPEFIFPKPRNWETFEDIVCDIFSRKFGNINFQRYGRSGQRQDGVDIVGPTKDGLLGIQCKHHLGGDIDINEIDDEITKAEKFSPCLGAFYFATSASRDTKVQSHVLERNELRKREGKFLVSIFFWEDIYNWLNEHPDLMYKHFTKDFPLRELENVVVPGLEENNRSTSRWPIQSEILQENLLGAIDGVKKIDPYNLFLGITTFADNSFHGKVDLEVDLSALMSNPEGATENFIGANQILRDVRNLLNNSFFSKKLFIFLQARLPIALLIGWNFRKVSSYELVLVSGSQVCATNHLPQIPTGLFDRPPAMGDPESQEIVLVVNISRDISAQVQKFLQTWEHQPRWIVTSGLEGSVASAAHALSISLELSRKIKTLRDEWGASKIHLFIAMPALLATLVGYHLNAICPIHLYFMDHTENNYELAGVLTNTM